MPSEQWGWGSGSGRGGLAGSVMTPGRSPTSSRTITSESMGGVGLVFYRDPGTPYLLVKEILPDGPAFRSTLVYPGDRLVAINDFDLAWSGSTPRSQQPQLPGKHGTSVTLSFDRTGETSPYPDRFNVTLVRDASFYPDRLSSSPYRPFMDHELSDLMKKKPNATDPGQAKPPGGYPWDPPHSSAHHRPGGSQQNFSPPQQRGAHPPGARSASNIYDPRYNDGYGMRSWGSPPGQGSGRDPYAYERQRTPTWGDRPRDAGGKGESGDLDDLIQDIAKNDQILELQQKLTHAEVEHDRRIKEMQRSQAGVEELVRNLRVELENSRDQVKTLQLQLHRNLEEASVVDGRLSAMRGHEEHIRELQAQVAKERVQRQAAERRITVERENALQKVNTFDTELREQIRALEAELEREKEMRVASEALSTERLLNAERQRGPDPNTLRVLQNERDVLAGQNEKMEGEIKTLRGEVQEARERAQRAAAQRDEHTYTQTHSYTRALEENKMLADQVRGLETALGDVQKRMEEQEKRVGAGAGGGGAGAEMETSWDIPGISGLQDRSVQGGTPVRTSVGGKVQAMAMRTDSTRSLGGAERPAGPVRTGSVAALAAARESAGGGAPPAPVVVVRSPSGVNVAALAAAREGRNIDVEMQQKADTKLPQRTNSLNKAPWQRQNSWKKEKEGSSNNVLAASAEPEPKPPAPPVRTVDPPSQSASGGGSKPAQPNSNNTDKGPIYVSPHHSTQSIKAGAKVEEDRDEEKHEPPAAPEPPKEPEPAPEPDPPAPPSPPAPVQEPPLEDKPEPIEEPPTPEPPSEPTSMQKPVKKAPSVKSASTAPQQAPANNPEQPAASVVKAGIGMSFQADPKSQRYVITEVHPSGPAGIAVNEKVMFITDALLAVNGVPVDGKPIPAIVQEILGPEHTPVQLTITRMKKHKPVGGRIILELVRVRPGTIPPGAKGIVRVVSDTEGKVGPTPEAAAVAAQSHRSNSLKAAGEEELPPGWVQETDPASGRVYYVNHTLKTFSWARPVAQK